MSKIKKYKFESGDICFEGPITDHTLCGMTLDEPSMSGNFIETKERVNCPLCIIIVKFCKSILLKEYIK